MVQHGDGSVSISRPLGGGSPQRVPSPHHSALRGERVSGKRVYQGNDTPPRTSYPSPPSTAGGNSPRRAQSPGNHSPFSTDAESASPRSSVARQTSQPPTDISPSRRKPSIEVASLLADPQIRIYRLEVVQQPLRTAEFGMNNLSRLPLTPPLLVKLTINDPTGSPVVPETELPFLIAHLSLHSEDGTRSLDMGSQIGRDNQAPILYGKLVSSVDHLEDLQGNMGLYFLFPDVSVRWNGRYQLGITLSRISRSDELGKHNEAGNGTQLCDVRTAVFDVVPLSQYSAAPQTPLTQAFIRQGARLASLLPTS
ncbi:hypothetical protein FA13DRAFT_688243 [Coprinellus micaceus]|uniref:Velvet domain-containing protein n=1 Tax=Coprinellus micaceus TaxID=71717 RepID=A0A4Y7T4Y6_COPMI|nr:hypothetical protein FA13DRAFT_688243 [Coprinellus micaceus]